MHYTDKTEEYSKHWLKLEVSKGGRGNGMWKEERGKASWVMFDNRTQSGLTQSKRLKVDEMENGMKIMKMSLMRSRDAMKILQDMIEQLSGARVVKVTNMKPWNSDEK